MFDIPLTHRASMQQVARDIEDEFGEPLLVIPVVKPSGMGQPIPQLDRAVEVRGVFSNRAALALKEKGPHRDPELVSTRTPQAVFTLATVDAIGFPIVRQTMIGRPDTDEVYSVSDVQGDGISAVTYKLTQLGKPNTLSGLLQAREDVGVIEAPAEPAPLATGLPRARTWAERQS